MSLVESIRKAVDSARAVPGRLGLHAYTVTRVTRTYSGGTVGHGSYSDVSLVLKVGWQNVHARQSTQSEIDQLFGEGSLFSEGSWLVGPMTPTFSGGGYDADSFDVANGTASIILYKIEGEGVSSENEYFRATRKTTGSPFSITLLLEQTNAKA